MNRKRPKPGPRPIEPKDALAVKRETRALLREVCPAVIQRLAEIATDEDQRIADQIAAGRIIVEYALAKPKDDPDNASMSTVQALIAVLAQPDPEDDEIVDVSS